MEANYNIVVVFDIHSHESAMGVHVFLGNTWGIQFPFFSHYYTEMPFVKSLETLFFPSSVIIFGSYFTSLQSLAQVSVSGLLETFSSLNFKNINFILVFLIIFPITFWQFSAGVSRAYSFILLSFLSTFYFHGC